MMTIKKDSNLIIHEVKRGIENITKILLFSRAAGRCEICNELVIKDKFTNSDVLFGEMAHIYAFSPGGARSKNDKLYNNDIRNLLLACSTCHTKIDKAKQVQYYSAELLLERKRRHENRIKLVTGFNDQRQTKVLKMKANINGELVNISDQDIVKGLIKEKNFPSEEKFEEIDFSNVSGSNDKIYWEQKKKEILQLMADFYSNLKRDKIEHVSVFGMGPMPLLMYLGSQINNKVKTQFFQRHRDGDGWSWPNNKLTAAYKFRKIQNGKNKNKVTLLLSLSGFVNKKLLPPKISDYYIYELYLSSADPNYNFLRSEADLFNFKKEFTTAISKIKNLHKSLIQIDVFPAVPAPVAIICGESLNKNSDPTLAVYNTSLGGKFKYALKIN
jgi:outer membrane protein OmpA-like peptidoglycan-associated protein